MILMLHGPNVSIHTFLGGRVAGWVVEIPEIITISAWAKLSKEFIYLAVYTTKQSLL